MAQLETRNILEEHRNSDNEIKLSDRHVYDINDVNDPIKHNCKGRPTTKRMKGYNEENYKAQKENVQNSGDNMNSGRTGFYLVFVACRLSFSYLTCTNYLFLFLLFSFFLLIYSHIFGVIRSVST
jgi:hypothetical protein